jgi:phenylacetate-CoA ligase
VRVIYEKLFRNVLFPFHDRVIRRRNIVSHLKELSPAPYLPRESIERMRSEKLAALVEYCRSKVPFYADLFRERNLGGGRVDDVAILREHGILTSKEIVQAAGDRVLSSEFDKSELFSSGTSGSTGIPVVFSMTIDNWSRRQARKIRSEDWIGKPLGTRTTRIWGHQTGAGWLAKTKFSLYWKFQNNQFFSAYDIGEDELARMVSRIGEFGSRFLESYVTPVYLMAQVIEKRGLSAPELDGILIGAERLHPYQKEKIETAFACPVFNRYGATEFSNVAGECSMRGGLHINEDDIWVEVVDAAGNPVTGEPGDLVITDLTNLAMPLIRYRIGDRGIMSETSCACGMNFATLEDIVGRESDVLRSKDGRAIHDQYFLWKIARAPGLLKFQVVQKTLSQIVVKMVQDTTISREVTEDFVRNALTELEQYGFEFELEFVDGIPLTRAGKLLSFISELDANQQARGEGAHTT